MNIEYQKFIDKLVGATTFRKLSKNSVAFLDIIFFAVDHNRRFQRLGTKLLQALQNICHKILLWADDRSIHFYKRKLFTPASSLYPFLVQLIEKWNNSLFMKYGFNSEEIQLLKSNV